MLLKNNYLKLGMLGLMIAAAPFLIMLVMLTSWNLAMIITTNEQVGMFVVFQATLFIKTKQLFVLIGSGILVFLSLLEWIMPSKSH